MAGLEAMAFGVCLLEGCCVQLLEVGWLASHGVRSGGLWRSGVFVLLEIEQIEIYPLQKGALRTSFPRWGVTVLYERGVCMWGLLGAPGSAMACLR